VLFVSHDLASLTKLCTRSLWLEAGRVRDSGPTTRIVRDYLTSGFVTSTSGSLGAGTGSGRLLDVAVRAAAHDRPALLREDPLQIVVRLQVSEVRIGLDVAVFVTNDRGVRVFDEALSTRQVRTFPPGTYDVVLDVPPVLEQGEYTVGVWVGTQHEDVQYEPTAASFVLHGDRAAFRDRAVVLPLPFTVTSVG
jgi:ABC-2 type transport system ATP-binding protein/lipopolysaccharide transport system ATP-binding protein